MPSINKMDLLRTAAEATGMTQAAAARVLDNVLAGIVAAVQAGETVRVAGFGVFKPRDRAAVTGRNPRTGDDVECRASRTVGFRPAAALRIPTE